jgi:hypothetical protein
MHFVPVARLKLQPTTCSARCMILLCTVGKTHHGGAGWTVGSQTASGTINSNACKLFACHLCGPDCSCIQLALQMDAPDYYCVWGTSYEGWQPGCTVNKCIGALHLACSTSAAIHTCCMYAICACQIELHPTDRSARYMRLLCAVGKTPGVGGGWTVGSQTASGTINSNARKLCECRLCGPNCKCTQCTDFAT